MERCPRCEGAVEPSFRFCPWCAEPRRRKLVEFFSAHRAIDRDRGKALRVSRYLGVGDDPRHIRFSVWSESGVAEGAVSLDERETARLVGFLAEPRPERRTGARRLYDRLLEGR